MKNLVKIFTKDGKIKKKDGENQAKNEDQNSSEFKVPEVKNKRKIEL